MKVAMEPDVLLVGDPTAAEFRTALVDLENDGRVQSVPDVGAALAALSAGDCLPALIVLLQSYPGQWSDADAESLWRAAPLARVVALLGTWCEGEMRTGRPSPGVIRIYWHQWTARWRQELSRLREGLCPTWELPVTATEEERLLLASQQPPPRCAGLVVIATTHRAMADLLSDACRQAGYATLWHEPEAPLQVRGACAALFDGTDCCGPELQRLRALAQSLRGVPILALLDFPRLEDCRRALDHGARAVISKPLAVDELWRQLEAWTARDH